MNRMNSPAKISDLPSLSPEERIRLVEQIWDSIAQVPEAVELTEAQRRELDARLESYRNNPQDGSPWDVVKSRLSKNR